MLQVYSIIIQLHLLNINRITHFLSCYCYSIHVGIDRFNTKNSLTRLISWENPINLTLWSGIIRNGMWVNPNIEE